MSGNSDIQGKKRSTAGELIQMTVSDELKAVIGTTIEQSILEVERGAIRRYADAIDDPNPLFRDVEYARNTRYGEMICPPCFFGWPIKGEGFMGVLGKLGGLLAQAGLLRILDGSVDFEFMLPIRAGDTLSSHGRIADIRERESKTGKMAFITLETTYMNQSGELVAKSRQTLIAH